jgi:hypothetical protein
MNVSINDTAIPVAEKFTFIFASAVDDQPDFTMANLHNVPIPYGKKGLPCLVFKPEQLALA